MEPKKRAGAEKESGLGSGEDACDVKAEGDSGESSGGKREATGEKRPTTKPILFEKYQNEA